MNTSNCMKKPFRFEVIPKNENGRAILKERFSFEINMTQNDFEDHTINLPALYAKTLEFGYTKDQICSIKESPVVSPQLIEKIKIAMEAPSHTYCYPQYEHSYYYRNYRKIVVDGVIYRAQFFQCEDYLKFAPDFTQDKIPA